MDLAASRPGGPSADSSNEHAEGGSADYRRAEGTGLAASRPGGPSADSSNEHAEGGSADYRRAEGTGLAASRPRPLVDVAWLADHLDEVVVADVRWYLDGRSGREAYDAGHLPGAVFVDLDTDLSAPPGPSGRHPLPTPEAFAAAMSRLGIGGGVPVVAYDDAGGVVAARLWWMLDVLGEPAAVLDGGIDAWPGPLDTDPAAPGEALFTPRPWPAERFVDADQVDILRARPNVLVLDARSPERYAGGPNPIDPRFGHIPGAHNAPCGGNLEGGRMRSVAALRERYEHLGAHQVDRVIAYCGSGVSACHDLLALRLAGFDDTALYVGSWSQWGADPARPVGIGDD